jgi:hypothetical protein
LYINRGSFKSNFKDNLLKHLMWEEGADTNGNETAAVESLGSTDPKKNF